MRVLSETASIGFGRIEVVSIRISMFRQAQTFGFRFCTLLRDAVAEESPSLNDGFQHQSGHVQTRCVCTC